MADVTSKGSDQTAHMYSLIRAIACHQCNTVGNHMMWLIYSATDFLLCAIHTVLETFSGLNTNSSFTTAEDLQCRMIQCVFFFILKTVHCVYSFESPG